MGYIVNSKDVSIEFYQQKRKHVLLQLLGAKQVLQKLPKKLIDGS